MIAEVNNVVLTTLVSKTLAGIQEGGGSDLCEAIDRAIGTILDLKIGGNVDADKLISDISAKSSCEILRMLLLLFNTL